MNKSLSQTYVPPLSREEIAKLEIGSTDVAPWLAWTMTIAFWLAMIAVPLAQTAYERVNAAPESAPHSWPRSLAIVTTLPDVAGVFGRTEGNLWRRTLAANRHLLKNIDDYESRLQDESLLSHSLLPPTQHALARLAGLGNEKAYLGREGWLFYRPSVDYLTGPGFLEPLALAKRAKGGKSYAAPLRADPRLAIADFARQLHRRGIALVVVPAPGEQIVVYLWGMQNNRWTAPAGWKPGEAVTLNLKPWDEVRAKYGSFTRIELDDPDFALIDLPLFWGEAAR